MTDTNTYTVPEFATLDEWEQWEADAKKNHRWRYLLTREIPRFARRTWRQFVHEPWYWLKCRVWHRHNVLVIRTLPPTWTDRDERLLHAAFQLLVDFAEREEMARGEWCHMTSTRDELIKAYDYSYDGCDQAFAADARRHAEQRADMWIELKALYDWWKTERPAREEPAMPNGKYDEAWGKAYAAFEKHCDQEDTAKLHRLIELRGLMWT